MKSIEKRSAFTLVEIMIAVIIIGVIAALAVPKYSKAREEARIRAAQADLELLSTAILKLAWDTKLFPGEINRTITHSAESWDLSTDEAGLLSASDAYDNWRGPYLNNLPEDPWGNKYFFDPDYPVDGVISCVVGSFGPNGVGPNKYDDDDLYVVVRGAGK